MRTRRFLLPVLAAVAMSGVSAYRAEGQQAGRVMIPHPAWDCGMPDGIPDPDDGNLIFSVEIPLDRAADVGTTQFGHRAIAVGRRGSVEGPKLSATVMQGALDFELTFANGTIEVEHIMALQASDGSYIYVRGAGAGADTSDVRVVLDIEAPNASEFAWLNSGAYVARRHLDGPAMTFLNTGRYLSSNPGRAEGGVAITMYDSTGLVP